MGHQMAVTQPMEVVELDYLDLIESRCDKSKSVLVIVDQLTRVCVIVPVMDKVASTASKIFHER